MAKIDLARRAEIGREKRSRTRAQIVEAGATLMAERPFEALTVDAVGEAAGVAKGTFYYHFQSMEVAATLTANDVDDGSQVGPLLDQVAGPVASFTGDGA